MTSSPNGRPERMLMQGRPIEPHFPPDEILYRRCTLDDLEGDYLSPASFHFREDSVNRSNFSEPDDLYYPDWDSPIQDYTGWGIATFYVRDLPEPLQTGGENKYDFRMIHVPLAENYSHSEIQTFKNGVRDRNFKLKTLSNKIKLKALKDTFCRKTKILRQPTIKRNLDPHE